jgi:hypothetical protein
VILWLAAACPKPVEVLVEPSPVPALAPPSDRTPILGPRYWSEPGGLCLEVPEGFSGTTGPPPLVLDLAQLGTGFSIQIRVSPAAEPLPDRAGFTVLFDSPGGSYRSVPILAPGAVSRTWLADDPAGPIIRTWSNRLGDRNVEVAAIYPRDRVSAGEQLLEPLLDSMCRTTLELKEAP